MDGGTPGVQGAEAAVPDVRARCHLPRGTEDQEGPLAVWAWQVPTSAELVNWLLCMTAEA